MVYECFSVVNVQYGLPLACWDAASPPEVVRYSLVSRSMTNESKLAFLRRSSLSWFVVVGTGMTPCLDV